MEFEASVAVKKKNVERLIARCENLVSGKTQYQGKGWKLAKVLCKLCNQQCYTIDNYFWNIYGLSPTKQYVAALCDQVRELENYPR